MQFRVLHTLKNGEQMAGQVLLLPNEAVGLCVVLVLLCVSSSTFFPIVCVEQSLRGLTSQELSQELSLLRVWL